jgi:hypothetical protein
MRSSRFASLGCVELPYDQATPRYGYLAYGPSLRSIRRCGRLLYRPDREIRGPGLRTRVERQRHDPRSLLTGRIHLAVGKFPASTICRVADAVGNTELIEAAFNVIVLLPLPLRVAGEPNCAPSTFTAETPGYPASVHAEPRFVNVSL